MKKYDDLALEQVDIVIDTMKRVLELDIDHNLDELEDYFRELGFNEKQVHQGINFYMDLYEMGPYKMYQNYPDLDWRDQFLNRYNIGSWYSEGDQNDDIFRL